MKLRKLILALCVALAIIAVAGVLTSCPAQSKGPKKLVVWSFTNELGEMLEYYKKIAKVDPAKLEIEFVLVPNDVYQSKLDPVLQSGKNAPDVFTAEAAFVRKYVESGYMMDLSGIKKAYANTAQYTLDVATNQKGKIVALSWQVTPGAFFLRRSIAKKYLGTDDPVQLQDMMSSGDKFTATAETLKQKSNGSAVIISSLGDLFQVYKAGRKDGWVKDGTLVIDPKMTELLTQAKLFHDKGYEGRQAQWGEGWFAGMKGALQDEKGKAIEVLGYFLPTWGLHYVLKPNAKSADGKVDTSGDWVMIQGPIPYFWGGTWLGARQGTTVKAEATALVQFLATNEEFLTQWATDKGDMVSNSKVVDKIKGTYSEPFLGGQNHYAAFADMAKNVNAKNLTGYDQTIESLWQEQQNAFVNGEKDMQKAIDDFKAAVKNSYPDMKV